MITPIYKMIAPICFLLLSSPILYLIPYTLYLSSCSPEKKSANEEKTEEKITLADESQITPAEKKEELTGGAKYYYENCKVCHGLNGKRMLAGAKDLSASDISMEERIKQISEGKNKMPGFKSILTVEQVKELAGYLDELKK